jgi:hypothetical protein
MTWDQLIVKLQTELTPEQRATDVTVVTYEDEYFGVHGILGISSETDILDKDHPFLVVKAIA